MSKTFTIPQAFQYHLLKVSGRRFGNTAILSVKFRHPWVARLLAKIAKQAKPTWLTHIRIVGSLLIITSNKKRFTQNQ